MPPEIKVGDIIAFSGRKFFSDVINIFSYGCPRWSASHVGIIGRYNGELLLFESTTLSNIPCVIQGNFHKGVQAVRLEDRLAAYEGRAWLYPLYRPLFDAEQDQLNAFLRYYIGTEYDRIGAIRSGGKVFSWFESLLHKENLDSIFCSELLAATHRHIGLIETDNVSRWNPNRLIKFERDLGIINKRRRLR
jgi:ASC-1-like (ASCH) protein